MINNIINFVAGIIVGFSISIILIRVFTEHKEDKSILDKDIDIINKLIKAYIREIYIKDNSIICNIEIANNSMINVEIQDIELKANNHIILKMDPLESNYIYPYIDKHLVLSGILKEINFQELSKIEILIKAKTRYHDLPFFICENKYKDSKIKIERI